MEFSKEFFQIDQSQEPCAICSGSTFFSYRKFGEKARVCDDCIERFPQKMLEEILEEDLKKIERQNSKLNYSSFMMGEKGLVQMSLNFDDDTHYIIDFKNGETRRDVSKKLREMSVDILNFDGVNK